MLSGRIRLRSFCFNITDLEASGKRLMIRETAEVKLTITLCGIQVEMFKQLLCLTC